MNESMNAARQLLGGVGIILTVIGQLLFWVALLWR